MPTHRGQMRKLQGPSLCAGERLSDKEGGPPGSEGVVVSLPQVEAAVEETQQPEEPRTEAERGPAGEAEVVTEAGQAPGGEAMEE